MKFTEDERGHIRDENGNSIDAVRVLNLMALALVRIAVTEIADTNDGEHDQLVDCVATAEVALREAVQ